MSLPLSLDRLRRIQATLERRVVQRDPENIQSVGFAPLDLKKQQAVQRSTLPVTAQFDVRRKRKQVADAERIRSVESLRLFDRTTKRYQQLAVTTDVEPTSEIVPTGVRVRTDADHATTSLVIRWTTSHPVPAPPQEDTDDLRWRWGVLTISHLFTADEGEPAHEAHVRRPADCGGAPHTVRGRIIARGRIPGGPDVALLETGLDRLWLSGFLPRVDASEIAPITSRELIRWTQSGTSGVLFADHVVRHWRWRTFYPALHLPSLGRLRHVIRFQAVSINDPEGEDRSSEATPPGEAKPLAPGTSGSVLVAGGIPVGIQVAALRPGFEIGYAQSLDASLPWLKRRLRASALAIVNVLTNR